MTQKRGFKGRGIAENTEVISGGEVTEFVNFELARNSTILLCVNDNAYVCTCTCVESVY